MASEDKPVILVAEDNQALLLGICELLELNGYATIAAENGAEALKALDRTKPDLIISDVMMPELDGYGLHSEVRARPEWLDIPFIFLTALGQRDDVRRGKEMGVDEYIVKPFDEADILIAVRAKLERWKKVRRHQEEESAELKRKIISSLSHEFRTPLTYVLNYAEMLQEETVDPTSDDFSLFLHGIRKGALRLNKLVMDFLLLVELETGEAQEIYLHRRREIEETSAWLRVIAGYYQDRAAERDLELVVDVPDGLPTLVADETYLSDAIGRLLDNAIKFSTKSSDMVRYSASVVDDVFKICIEDQGIGIRSSEIDSLFNVFHQIDRAQLEQQGTGSGLAISNGIVTLHGGSIDVQSEYGQGSVFTVSIPRKPPE
ncbi:MAG: hybrid sensor histidine kinase/response regulator [Anaerolineales bacterium]|jgi:signal transduction histidine kinase